MSTLYKRGSVWWIAWMTPAGRRFRSTRVKIADDPRGVIAKQVQRDIDTGMARNIAGLEDERLTVAECFRRWLLTLRESTPRWLEQSRIRAEKWTAWLTRRGIITIDQVSGEVVGDWIHERRLTASPKTVRIEVDQLKAAAKHANLTRKVSPIPIDSWPTIERVVAARPERVGSYSPEEVGRILEDLNDPRRNHWYLPVLFLAYLGCRWAELENMRVGDVRLGDKPPVVRIESKKTGRTYHEQHRYIEIHPDLVATLSQIVEGRPWDERVLQMPDQHNVTNVVRRCCKRLKIQYRRLHGIRHFWITSMLEAGVPLPIVMQMAGHRNLKTTQGYMHLSDRNVGWINKLPTGPGFSK